VVGTEPMPSLVWGYTELGGGKLKNGNGFLKPNFEVGPKLCQVRLYRNSKNSSGRVNEKLLLERGLYPGVETPDVPGVLDGGGVVGGGISLRWVFECG
jgi:hypothetical protein